MNNRNGKFGIYYHIFCDNQDFYEDTYKKANTKFNQLKSDGQQNIRLYQCWFGTKEDYIGAINGEISWDNEESNCMRNFGDWPS